MGIPRLGNIPIQRKLSLIILMISFIVVLISTLALVGTRIVSFQNSLVAHLSTLARVVGFNSQASLSFQDQAAAGETLSALQAEPSVRFAQIITLEGLIFAEYSSPKLEKDTIPASEGLEPERLKPLQPGMQKHHFHYRYLDLWQPIVLDQEVIGTVYIRADLNELYDSLWRYGVISGGVLVVALLIALSLSTMFQKIISGPILNLVETAKQVSKSRNYGIRVAKKSNDELGVL
ncbi:MAG: CHASE sensor domain-containing protein, partial [Desulfobacterales bacterium]